MPEHGDTWFYVEPNTTVAEFKQSCQAEDAKLSQIDVLIKDGFAQETEPIYKYLESKQPLYLRLNNITYEFDSQLTAASMQLTESE